MGTSNRTFVPTYPVWFVWHEKDSEKTALWLKADTEEGELRSVCIFTDSHEADAFMCNRPDSDFLTACSLADPKTLLVFLDGIEAKGVSHVAFDPQPPRAPFIVSIAEIRLKTK